MLDISHIRIDGNQLHPANGMTGDFGVEIMNVLISQSVEWNAFAFVGQALVGKLGFVDGIRFVYVGYIVALFFRG